MVINTFQFHSSRNTQIDTLAECTAQRRKSASNFCRLTLSVVVLQGCIAANDENFDFFLTLL